MAAGLVVVGLLLPMSQPAQAAINSQINFQGRLLNSAGAVVADGTYNMEFQIWQGGNGCVTGCTTSNANTANGGTLKWTEDWIYGTGSPDNRVVVKNGYFSVQLGALTSLSSVDFTQSSLWLSMNVGDTSTAASFSTLGGYMIPFKRMAASPYALEAANADALGGLTSSQFIQNVAPNLTQQTANINIVSGAAANVATAEIQGPTSATAPVLVLKDGATPGTGGDLLDLQNSSSVPLASFDSSGNLKVASSIDTQTNTTLTIGATNASVVQLGSSSTDVVAEDHLFAAVKLYAGVTSVPGNIVGTITSVTTTTGTVGLVVRPGSGSQTADLVQVQDGSGSNVCMWRVGATGTTGSCDSSTGATSNSVFKSGDVTGTGNTGNVTIESGSAGSSGGNTGYLSLTTGNASAATKGSGAITLQTGTAATGVRTGAIAITTGNGTGSGGSSGAITIQSGNAGSSGVAPGAVTVDTGTNTGTVGTLNLGNANAGIIAIGNTTAATTTTIQGGTGSSAVSIQTGTNGNINIGTSGTDTVAVGNTTSTTVDTLQGGASSLAVANAGTTVLTTSNSTTAFSVQTSGGAATVLDVDTTHGRVGIGTAAPTQALEIYNGNAQIDYGYLNLSELAAPTAPSGAPNGTTGGPNGAYYYVVTFTTANGQTNYSAASTQVTTGGAHNVTVTIPTGITGVVTGRNIYRTLAAGANTGPFYLVGNVANDTATTYNDASTDATILATNVQAPTMNTSSGAGQVAVGGSGILQVDSNSGNSSVGIGALTDNTSGLYNMAFGTNALFGNTSGSNNVGIGVSAFNNNGAGSGNIGIGENVGAYINGGTYNTAIGYNTAAGTSLTSGNYNTIIGSSSATVSGLTTATSNVIIGYNDLSTALTTQLTSNIVIGNNVASPNTGTVANYLNIGNILSGNMASAGTITLDSASAGTLTIGTTNATTINVGSGANSSGTEAVNIGNGATSSGVDNVTIGSTNAGSTTTIKGGTGNINLQTNSSSAGVVFQTQTNSTAAFELQNAVGATVLGASTVTSTNLLANPSFEGLITTAWAVKTNATLTQQTTATNIYSGADAGQVTTSGAGGSIKTNGTAGFASGSVPAAGTYTLSFYAKLASGTFTTLVAGYNNGSDNACTLNSSTVLTTGFQRYSCTFTYSGTLSFIYIGQTDAAAHTLYLDGVQMQSNSSLTPYQIGGIQLNGIVTGPVVVQNNADSTTAFQIQNAAGTNNLFVADTLDGMVGIGMVPSTATTSATLQVAGKIESVGNIIEVGPTSYGNGAQTALGGPNSAYLVVDKSQTGSDASIILRDQGNTAAEIGLATDDNLHVKAVTGTDGTNGSGLTFTDAIIVYNSTADVRIPTALGIGTPTTPAQLLHIAGSSSTGSPSRLGIKLENDGTDASTDIQFASIAGSNNWIMGDDSGQTGGENFFLQDGNNSNFPIYVNSSDQVGIGNNTTPGATLDVTGTSRVLTTTNSATAFNIQNATNNSILQVGTTNINGNVINNPGVEAAITSSDWPAAGYGSGVTASRVTSTAWDGNASLQVATTGTANTGAKAVLGAGAAGASGSYWTLSFEAKLGTGSPGNINAVYSPDGTTGHEIACIVYNTQTIVTTGWTHITCAIQLTATAGTSSAYVAIRQTAAVTATFYLDAVQFEQTANIPRVYGAGSVQLDGVITSPVGLRNTEDSTDQMEIQNSAGSDLFVVDSLDKSIKIGGGNVDADNNPVTLVVDTSLDGTSDPTGVPGAIYYNYGKEEFRCYNPVTGWNDCMDMPRPNTRRWTYIVYPGSGTTFNAQGDIVTQPVAPTVVSATNTLPAMLSYATGGTINTVASASGNFNYAAASLPVFQTYAKLSTTSNIRFWAGLTAVSAATMGASKSPTGNYAAFRYDTSGTTDGTFKCVTSDGSTVNAASTGVTADTGAHKFEIRIVSGSVIFKIDDKVVCTSVANLPSVTSLLGYSDSVTDLTAATLSMQVPWIYIDSNF